MSHHAAKNRAACIVLFCAIATLATHPTARAERIPYFPVTDVSPVVNREVRARTKGETPGPLTESDLQQCALVTAETTGIVPAALPTSRFSSMLPETVSGTVAGRSGRMTISSVLDTAATARALLHEQRHAAQEIWLGHRDSTQYASGDQSRSPATRLADYVAFHLAPIQGAVSDGMHVANIRQRRVAWDPDRKEPIQLPDVFVGQRRAATVSEALNIMVRRYGEPIFAVQKRLDQGLPWETAISTNVTPGAELKDQVLDIPVGSKCYSGIPIEVTKQAERYVRAVYAGCGVLCESINPSSGGLRRSAFHNPVAREVIPEIDAMTVFGILAVGHGL